MRITYLLWMVVLQQNFKLSARWKFLEIFRTFALCMMTRHMSQKLCYRPIPQIMGNLAQRKLYNLIYQEISIMVIVLSYSYTHCHLCMLYVWDYCRQHISDYKNITYKRCLQLSDIVFGCCTFISLIF